VLLDPLAKRTDRRRLRKVGRGLRAGAEGVVAEAVLLKLEPEVAQLIGRVVVVGDASATDELGRHRVKRDGDVVVDPLLPVALARRARSRALVVRRGQHFLELPERVAFLQDRWRHDERCVAAGKRVVRRAGERR
jgi:hypothetical protein